MATRFRTRVGESLATVRSHERPLAEATTPSFEALKAYTEGLIAIRTTGTGGAIPLLKRAVELDPSFAIAHATLGLAYSGNNEATLAIKSNTRAFTLRDHASDPEKFFIEYVYERDVTGNLDKARQTAEIWTQTYPRDVIAHSLLGGYGTQGTGRYEQTISASRRALALDPTEQFGYLNIAWACINLDRYDEAARALQEAADQHLDGTDLAIPRYMLGFLRGDASAMEQAFARTHGTPSEYTLRLTQALTLARSGRLREAESMALAVAAAIRQSGAIERAIHYETAIAIWDALAGNAASARRRAAALLEASKARDIEYGAGFALAVSGDVARAQPLAADLEARFPEDTLVRFLYVPTLRALVALDRHDAAAAIALLQPSIAYELGDNGLAFEAKFGNLHTAYVRGLAYLASGAGRDAAAEFQKILDHRGLVRADPLAAAARVQKARAMARAGDREAARAAYDDVLTLWKDADAGVPEVTRTRLERQQLH
jgi:tetratricopeptide (TPR) repeat protein